MIYVYGSKVVIRMPFHTQRADMLSFITQFFLAHLLLASHQQGGWSGEKLTHAT